MQGAIGSDGTLTDAFEQSFPREEKVIAETVAAGRVPALEWVATQDVKAPGLGRTGGAWAEGGFDL